MEEIEVIGKLREGEWQQKLHIGEYTLDDIAGFVNCKFLQNEIVHISYMFSKKELSKEEFLENRLKTIFGSVDIDSNDIYGSEWTGYMWTDEQFQVGRHDLLDELESHLGSYCYLKIYNVREKRDMVIDDVLQCKNSK